MIVTNVHEASDKLCNAYMLTYIHIYTVIQKQNSITCCIVQLFSGESFGEFDKSLVIL